MEELESYRQELISALENVVDELSTLVAGIPSATWHVPLKPYARTPHYILAHLCRLEAQLFATQLHRIQAEEIPVLSHFDDQAWMAEHYAPDTPAQAMLDEFVRLRKQEVEWLRNLPPQSWSRTSRHLEWGVRTLQWWVELQLHHSHEHLIELAAG